MIKLRLKKEKKTSEVWKHFKVCDQKLDDGTILPRAVCIYCKHALTCRTTNGTGHLRRHFNACLKKMFIIMLGSLNDLQILESLYLSTLKLK